MTMTEPQSGLALQRAAMMVLLAAAVIAVSRAAALLADRALDDSSKELPGLTLRYVLNPGVSFGIGARVPPTVLMTVTACILLAVALAGWSGHLPLPASGLIIGGGAANIIDRLGDGLVTDYIDLGWWPVFNLPDIAITTGAVLVVLQAARHEAPEQSSR